MKDYNKLLNIFVAADLLGGLVLGVALIVVALCLIVLICLGMIKQSDNLEPIKLLIGASIAYCLQLSIVGNLLFPKEVGKILTRAEVR